MRKAIVAVIALIMLSFLSVSMSMANETEAEKENSIQFLTNPQTDLVEARVEFPIVFDSEHWGVGALMKYYEDSDESGDNFAAGVFAKLDVDPNTLPVVDWLPQLFGLVSENLVVKTYIIS